MPDIYIIVGDIQCPSALSLYGALLYADTLRENMGFDYIALNP